MVKQFKGLKLTFKKRLHYFGNRRSIVSGDNYEIPRRHVVYVNLMKKIVILREGFQVVEYSGKNYFCLVDPNQDCYYRIKVGFSRLVSIENLANSEIRYPPAILLEI